MANRFHDKCQLHIIESRYFFQKGSEASSELSQEDAGDQFSESTLSTGEVPMA